MKNRCPITYEPLMGDEKYSQKGLSLLSPRLSFLKDFPWSAEEQRVEGRKQAHKISIQGVQPKLSAILNVKESAFEISDIGGTYILKPQNDLYRELPENEDLSMRLAACVGIETPLHGLIHCKDGSFTYFIKRFDRFGKGDKRPLEDFAQLSGATRETKYDYTMEKLVPLLDRFCAFPAIEKRKLFFRTVFNFLIGNEDMHLKNFSLITRDGKVELSPSYDFLNSTIALENAQEEIALSLRGKKRKLNRSDFDYFGGDRLELNDFILGEAYSTFQDRWLEWQRLIESSFLSETMKGNYLALVKERGNRLSLY